MISHGSGGLVTDTVEPYAWGKELQLGYVKHPPFWSWVAYAWYAVLPTSDWAAYLLSALNAAIGLGCTYLIALRFVPERQAMAGDSPPHRDADLFLSGKPLQRQYSAVVAVAGDDVVRVAVAGI